MMTHSDKPFLTVKANQILEFLKNQGVHYSNFEIVDTLQGKNGVFLYSSKNRIIQIAEDNFPNNKKNRYGKFLKTLIHEAAHAEDPFLKDSKQFNRTLSFEESLFCEAYVRVRGKQLLESLDDSLLSWVLNTKEDLLTDYDDESKRYIDGLIQVEVEMQTNVEEQQIERFNYYSSKMVAYIFNTFFPNK